MTCNPELANIEEKMKKILPVLILLNLPFILLGQNTDKELLKNKCQHRNLYAVEQRNSFYPFNKASSVLLVSFKGIVQKVKGDELIIENDIKNDTLIITPEREYLIAAMPIENNKVEIDKMHETIYLNKSQTDALTDLLYNVGYREKPTIRTIIKCYYPHNAILFMDDRKNVFEYIELCFTCQRNVVSSEKIKTGEFCTGKYELLKQLFKKFGIKYTGDQFN